MTRRTLSVLLPYRNAAATLDEALASVRAQRDVPLALEIVCVDDGSTDAGPAIVRHHAAADARVIPIEAGGVGIAGALARGLAVAGGTLLARMDADDVAHPDRLAVQARALASMPRVAALGARVEAFADDGPIGAGLAAYVAWQNALLTPEDHARELFVESPLCHPTVLLRRDAVEAVGGFRVAQWAEDYDLWLRLDAAGHALAKVPEVLLRWRHGAGRLTFTDPVYALARFAEARAFYLAPRLAARGPITVWGAGDTGRRFARALVPHGLRVARFVDIDPRKIGRTAYGAPIVAEHALARGDGALLVAVGARGARAEVRAKLGARGFVEGDDYLCVA